MVKINLSRQAGCTDIVRQLEERIATFVGKPAAIVFGRFFKAQSCLSDPQSDFRFDQEWDSPPTAR
jgi:hypothetical protein